jgi:hypothetical protein
MLLSLILEKLVPPYRYLKGPSAYNEKTERYERTVRCSLCSNSDFVFKEQIIEHLAGKTHQDKIGKLLPILLVAITILYVLVIFLPPIPLLNIVIIFSIVIVIPIGVLVYLWLKEYRGVETNLKKIYRLSFSARAEAIKKRMIFELVVLIAVLVVIAPYLVLTSVFPLSNLLNIIILAAVITSTGYLLVLYRHYRVGGKASELVLDALPGAEGEIVAEVWNKTFGEYRLRPDGVPRTGGEKAEKTLVFSTIYGILAGLAITIGLQNYYEHLSIQLCLVLLMSSLDLMGWEVFSLLLLA